MRAAVPRCTLRAAPLELVDIGLGIVDRAPPLKELFIKQAAGLTGEMPRLLKGEAL